MGINVERDELYDSKLDERNEEWTVDSHCGCDDVDSRCR